MIKKVIVMEIREAKKEDLKQLLKLYTQLHNNDMPEFNDRLEGIWIKILSDESHHIVIGLLDNEIVSSCVIVIIPNLTRSQRPYALVENVITHEAHRNKGYATRILNFAREIAKQKNCYKIMLLTGSKQENTLNLYRRAGYNSNDKTAFIQWL